MYEYMRGILVRRTDDYIVVENGGIGYHINCPFIISSALGKAGDETTVYLFQNVKEDEISLYGFCSAEQKDMFLLLISVSGIGPKMAQAVCGQLNPDRFALAVMGGDVKLLSSVKGLGKKTAERMVLELRDKLKKAGVVPSGNIAADVSIIGSEGTDSGIISDATDALVVLGYKQQDAAEAVSSAFTPDITLQTLIKNALALMVR